MTDELRVDGRVIVYRLHDIGYAVALDRAAELLGAAPTSRARSRFENPPISFGVCSLNGEGQSARAELLEIAIIALIVAELVLAVLRGSP